MYEISVGVGTCLVTINNSPTTCWTVLNHYGISRNDLKKLDLSYEELYEVYSNIKKHEQIRSFLKELKTKISMTTNN